MIQKIAGRLAQTTYIREILESPTNLQDLRKRPTPRMIAGLILIGLSYLIGWPAVAALGVLAVYFGEPLLVVVGGPLIYGFSHVVFFLGAWLAGAHYAKLLTRYAAKVLFRKLLRQDAAP